jgi:hypothetical protein
LGRTPCFEAVTINDGIPDCFQDLIVKGFKPLVVLIIDDVKGEELVKVSKAKREGFI